MVWQDELQSIEIVIRRDARASSDQFSCIHKAAATKIVTFEEQSLQSVYSGYTVEVYRPRMIAETKAAVTKLGLLNDFPKRSHYTDLRKNAGALEPHCELMAGSVLRVSGDSVSFDPPRETDPMVFTRKYEKILAVVMYATAVGDLKQFGFIGNAAVAESPDSREKTDRNDDR